MFSKFSIDPIIHVPFSNFENFITEFAKRNIKNLSQF